MKLSNTRERLIQNVRFWRTNLERGRPNDRRTLQLLADLVLIEKALKEPFSQQFEIDYDMPSVAAADRSDKLWLPSLH